ncbi:MAG: di-trans,poly-cis-decaprenylcistransferase [Candidatus Korarchaeota archaeon]|nr:di-trans,poly-cis-decaprenylcistransferase [Candidatus Korarchaeota archaeon]NIU83223.1 di-trans,poly-cis-decaprenylcistransferase [Candidatus Thorarchaeota archaeon]NIW13169.1 di-trans,poly-cis-decaprenylcistransferase [Candidatus Thorarchaeota archaeon]NIW51310.1 di-trans,poly-cis-decaprenylcistransferase [Candidatus Korarchaeota archaeon]
MLSSHTGSNTWGVEHLGLIPDGNRRWGKQQGIDPAWKAHTQGAAKLKEFLDWCLEANVPKVSIYTLSTENLNRSPQELQHLFHEIRAKVEELLTDEKIHSHEVKIRFLGKLHRLPPGLLTAIKKVMNRTKEYQKRVINFLIEYGGKYELVNAFNNLLTKAMDKMKREAEARIEVTPQAIEDHLLVKEPLDLIIRTGREHRLSNFMLWQASYAEIYTSEKLWPAFEKSDFYHALNWYSNRQRRFGE